MVMEPAGATPIRVRRTRRRVFAVAAAAGLTLTAAAAMPSASARPATARAGKIQYTSNTVLVPTKTLDQQLLSVSKDGATYIFKSKHGVLGKLKPGKVMLLQHFAVRDVKRAQTTHGHFVVSTTPAKITDVIQNGSLSLSSPIDFAKGFVVGGSAVPPEDATQDAASALAAKFGMVPLASAGEVKVSGKVKGYEWEVGFQKEGKSVAVSVTITRKQPVKVDVTITGTLDNFKTGGNISINKGKLSKAKMLANSLQGSFKLEYSAKPISQFGLGKAGGIKVELPAEIAVPFFVGPVPFFVGVRVAFFASAGFSSFDQKLSGSWTMKYDGQGGFTTSSSGATTGAGILKGLADIILNARNAVRNGPLSFILGAQMPQLELGLGIKGFNVAGNVTLIGSTEIATQGSNCDTRKMEIEGSAGASATFFGISASTSPATLFDKTINAAYPRGCGTAP
jgi:hypothetical protein